MSVFSRALARTGAPVLYSQGFNPRPQFSLPLPGTVGLTSLDDLLSVRLRESILEFDEDQFAEDLCAQLPAGCQPFSIKVLPSKVSVHPTSAVYMVKPASGLDFEKLRNRIEQIMASDAIQIERKTNEWGDTKLLDVRGFLISIEMIDNVVTVECSVGNEGSIRVEEILNILQLDIEQLAEPICRSKVKFDKDC
jgi:radical SAM-linked protein